MSKTSPAPQPGSGGVRGFLEDAVRDVRVSWSQVFGAARAGQGGAHEGWVGDLLIVVGLLFLNLVVVSGLGTGWMLLGWGMALPLFWRRRAPLLVACLVAAVCLVQLVVLDEPHPGNVAVPVAVYSAAAFGSRRDSMIVLGLGLVGAVLAGLDWSSFSSQPLGAILVQTTFMAMFVGVAWTLGDVLRRRRAVVANLQAQNRALARDQAQRSKLAAQDERASIAREMHDVVAHSLAVVVVQADGALYAARAALEAPPGIGHDRAALERAATTLETLASTARASLADTRRLVGVLREEGSGAEYSPLQGLAHVEDLVGGVRASGVPVDLAVRGRIDDLPRDVDLAAYRVIQESLTNAMKHAGPDATVDVDVLRTPAVLLVRVTDDGHGLATGSDGEGNGVLGMAERVEVLGGTVHAGPRGAGRRGWEVVATIPTRPTQEAGDPGDRRDRIPPPQTPDRGARQ